jgi:hypothetical protein
MGPSAKWKYDTPCLKIAKNFLDHESKVIDLVGGLSELEGIPSGLPVRRRGGSKALGYFVKTSLEGGS